MGNGAPRAGLEPTPYEVCASGHYVSVMSSSYAHLPVSIVLSEISADYLRDV